MALYEALYGRKFISSLCWEVGERQLTGPELVQITSEKFPIIQQKLKTAFSRQKSYADPKRKDMSFSSGDLVFHVSILRKYIPDPSHVLQPQTVEISEDFTYEEYPVAIIDR